MLASNWKYAEYICKTGKKNAMLTPMLNRCLRLGLLEGIRMNRLPSGYATNRQAMSCEVLDLEGQTLT